MITHHLKSPLCGRISRLSCALGGDGDEPVSSATVSSCRKPASSHLKRGRKKGNIQATSYCYVLGLIWRWRADKISLSTGSGRVLFTGAVEGNPMSDSIVHLCPAVLFQSPSSTVLLFPHSLPAQLTSAIPTPTTQSCARSLTASLKSNSVNCKPLACTVCFSKPEFVIVFANFGAAFNRKQFICNCWCEEANSNTYCQLCDCNVYGFTFKCRKEYIQHFKGQVKLQEILFWSRIISVD